MAKKRICKYYFNNQEFTEEELQSALLSGYFDKIAEERGIKLPTMKAVSEDKLKKVLSKSQIPSSGTTGVSVALNSLPNIKINVNDADFALASAYPEAVHIKNDLGDTVAVYLMGEVYTDPYYFSNENATLRGAGYVWMEIAKSKDPALFKAFTSDIKNTQYFIDAQNKYPGASDEQIAHLAAAEMISDEANKLKDPTLKQRFSNFISKIGQLMGKLFGVKKDVDFLKMNSKDFSEAISKELMGAKPISKVTSDQLLNAERDSPAISIEGGLMEASPRYADRLIQRLSGKDKTIIIPRYFKSVGSMLKYWFKNTNIDKLNESRLANVSASIKRQTILINEFRDTLKKYVKDNNLDDAQSQRLIDDINTVLKGGMGPISSTLSPELQNVVQRMRDEIDHMSKYIQQYIDPTTDLYGTISDNLGVYMNRSYAAFKDNRWSKKMFPSGMSTKVDSNAKRELMFQNIYEQAYKYIQSAYPNLSPSEIDLFLKKLARVDKGEQSFEIESGKLGKAMEDFLSKRKDIAPELRAFLGEYTDPITNFYHTMENMIRYAENKRFLENMKAMGMDKIFFDKPSGEYNVLVAKDDSYSPLAGLYTSREIAETLKQTDKSFKIGFLRKVAVAFKLGKTALSPASIVRNFWSYVFVHGANGHINPFNGGFSSFKLAYKELRKNPDEALVRLTELGVLDSGANSGDLRAAINEAFNGADIAMGDEAFYNSMTDKLSRFASKTTGNIVGVYKAIDDAHKIFAYYSELASIEYMFPNLTKEEQETLAVKRIQECHVFYNKAPKAVTRLAKSPVLGTFPTWTSETIRISFGIPKVGMRDIKEGIKSGNGKQVAVGMKRMAGYTSTALLISGLAGGVGSVLVGQIAKFLGADDEEDEEKKDALQRVLWEGSPSWAKSSTRIILDSPEVGVYRFIDVDWLNPFSVYSRAYNMYSRTGKFDTEKNPMFESFYELGKNFIGEEAALSIILNAKNGVDSKGNPLYNEDDDVSAKLAAQAAYMLYEMSPGLTRTVEDIYRATTREEGFAQEAEVKDATDVLIKNTLGGDVKRVDVAKQFKSKVQTQYATNFQEQYNSVANVVYNSDKDLAKLDFQYSKGQISESDYKKGVQDIKNQAALDAEKYAARFVGTQIDLNQYAVALFRLGVDPNVIQDKMDQGLKYGTMGGFPKVKFKEVLRGDIQVPFELDFGGVLDNAPSMKFKPKDGGAFFALPKSYLQSIGVSNQGEYIEYLRNLNNFQKEEINKKLE